tara:strand:- start:1441 stop:1668 length:228 start_codon:yes stop_codon:yes gene_type:complete
MPLIRQRKKDRRASKNTQQNTETCINISDNKTTEEPEIKKFLGDKTKSSIKKKQKITKKRRNDNKYERVYTEFII